MAKVELQFGELGGKSIDLTSPDVSGKFNVTGGTSTGTPTLTVTQVPKYIICLVTKTDNTVSLCVVADVENETSHYWSLSSSNVGSDDNLAFSSFFTVSASSVTFNVYNLMGGNNSRTHMLIYY